jgi:anti-anti-sigma factor
MNLTTEIFGDCVVVHAPQDLGRDQADRFEAFIRSLDKIQVVLDLDDAEQIDSAGLSAMVDAQERLKAIGGDLKIATGNEVNRKIFEITRLDRQFDLFESVIDAVKSYR